MEPEEDKELAAEIAEVREMLDSRYDDIVNGRVKPIDGEKAMAMLKKRTEEQRKLMGRGENDNATRNENPRFIRLSS